MPVWLPVNITVTNSVQTLDFGDAPSPYPTLLANNGARHRMVPGIYLGQPVDPEPEGQPNADATGDDAAPLGGGDDEDGIASTSLLVPGQRATNQVSLSWDSQGVLQTAPTPTGPWTDLLNAPHPFVLETTQGQAFFRVRFGN